MRSEHIFIPFIGDSLNQVIGHPKGHLMHGGHKKKCGEAMMYAGAHRIKPFDHPVELFMYPLVVKGKSGRFSKRYDCVNFATTYKMMEDHLVSAGVLKDDSREYVHAVHCMRAEEAKDGQEGVVIVIQEVEDSSKIPSQDEIDIPEPLAF